MKTISIKVFTAIALLLIVQASAQTPAPTLKLETLKGAPTDLALHRGKIVVLNFWATWCVPCKEEMPMLSKAQEDYEKRGVIVLGVNTDDESTRRNISKFFKQTRINFDVWIGASTADMERFGLGNALPATAFIDQQGRIVGRVLGPLEEADIRHRIEYLLGERTGPPPEPLVNNIEKALRKHEEETGHQHGSVALEGASSVPS
jgi:thiol-disulfide isomerase/thioredoxin